MEVWALDGFTPTGPITHIIDLSVTERDLAVGGWTLTLPITAGASQAWELLNHTYPGIEIYDPSTGWRFAGILTKTEEVYDPEHGDSVTLSGTDLMAWLQDRLDYPRTDDITLYWQNIYSGTVQMSTDLRIMVSNNAVVDAPPGPNYIDRKIPNLVVAPDRNIGPSYNRHIIGQPMLEVINERLLNTEWTARLKLVRNDFGTPTSYFDVLPRPVSSLVLDAQRGTLATVKVTTEADVATYIIAMGAEFVPETGQKYIAAASYPPASMSWQRRHIEQFVNRPSVTEESALITEAEAAKSQAARARSVQIEGAPVEGYGSQIDIGWYVDVALGRAGDAALERLPVVASKLTFRPGEGWRRTVDLGTQSLQGPDAVFANLSMLSRRIRNNEIQLGRF